MARHIDAVTVSTPDHTHALAALTGIRLGKHVYCQKPLAHSVFECRVLKEAARKHGVCTQMGNQGSAENGLRRAVELVQSGVIGDVKEAHVWTNRPIWPQAPQVTERPEKSDVCPPTLHWDEFLAGAPERPYVKGVYHPFNWRGWLDFGTGAIGDMACHTANMAFRALKLAHPTTISAESGEVNNETYPGWAHVTLKFPARESLPAVTVNWYEGHRRTASSSCPPKTSSPRSSPTARSSRAAARSSSATRAFCTPPTTTAPASSSPPRTSSTARSSTAPRPCPSTARATRG